jgi:hypothetical protein
VSTNIENEVWMKTFLFVSAMLNRAEVPCVWKRAERQIEWGTFSFHENASEYSVGYGRRVATFESKILFLAQCDAGECIMHCHKQTRAKVTYAAMET